MSVIPSKNNELEISEFNDFSLSSDTINTAIEVFNDQLSLGLVEEGEFDSLTWRFISKNRFITVLVDFNEIREQSIFKRMDSDLIIMALKCWFMIQLPNRSVESLKKYLDYLKEFLVITNFLDEELIDNTKLFLQHTCDDSRRWNLCVPTLNFIDFIEEADTNMLYRTLLVDVKKNINMENVIGKVRSLPSSKEVLTFSFTLEDYISKTQKGSIGYFKHYPIYLWWIISNIIPMRPSEFCAIERNSVQEENGNYFIKLPRIKQKNNLHKIQIVDKILITKQIFLMLSEYVQLTERFGKSITLISPKSYKSYQKKNYKEHRFTYSDLQILINSFYKEIIEDKYNIPFAEQVSPGDTRHFAFLNLMRQGYHPIEIARLGGHTSLQAQYHYQQHMEYWVDVEIVQLMQRTAILNKESSNLTNYPTTIIDNDFINEKVLKPNESNFICELEIGYCTDPDMFCQTEKCYYCPSWKISVDEFSLKKEIIYTEIQNCKTTINRLTATMRNLFNIALREAMVEEDISESSLDFQKDLFFTKNQLDTALHQLIILTSKTRKED